MTNHNPADTNWEDCPQGKISTFARRLKASDRKSPVRFPFVATLAILSGILVVQLSEASQLEMQRLSNRGGISCTEVMANVDRFIRGELTGSFRTEMGFHISNCPHCASKVRGVVKKDFFSGLFGSKLTSSSGSEASHQQTKRKWCDDEPASVSQAVPRIPVVAEKVLAAAEN